MRKYMGFFLFVLRSRPDMAKVSHCGGGATIICEQMYKKPKCLTSKYCVCSQVNIASLIEK